MRYRVQMKTDPKLLSLYEYKRLLESKLRLAIQHQMHERFVRRLEQDIEAAAERIIRAK